MIQNRDGDIQQLLDFDPVDISERTGDGVLNLMFLRNIALRQLAAQTGDASQGDPLLTYWRLFEELGFEPVYEEQFWRAPVCQGDTGHYDRLWLLWSQGMLLVLESYKDSASKVEVHYCRVPRSPKEKYIDHENGCPAAPFFKKAQDLWIAGEVDYVFPMRCSMSMESFPRYKLSLIKASGRVLPVWLELGFLWLVNGEEKAGDYDWKEIRDRKVAQLPAAIRHAMTPEDE